MKIDIDILLKFENMPVIVTGRKWILSVTHEIMPDKPLTGTYFMHWYYDTSLARMSSYLSRHIFKTNKTSIQWNQRTTMFSKVSQNSQNPTSKKIVDWGLKRKTFSSTLSYITYFQVSSVNIWDKSDASSIENKIRCFCHKLMSKKFTSFATPCKVSLQVQVSWVQIW